MPNTIDIISEGQLVVKGRAYHHDILIFQDLVIPHWKRADQAELSLEDLAEVIQRHPKILVVGTGYGGAMKVSSDLLNRLKALSMEVIMGPSLEVVPEYNERVHAGLDVVGAFYVGGLTQTKN